MRFNHAKNLHNEDEVIHIESGEVLRVLSVDVYPEEKRVLVETCNGPEGWHIYSNEEIA